MSLHLSQICQENVLDLAKLNREMACILIACTVKTYNQSTIRMLNWYGRWDRVAGVPILYSMHVTQRRQRG